MLHTFSNEHDVKLWMILISSFIRFIHYGPGNWYRHRGYFQLHLLEHASQATELSAVYIAVRQQRSFETKPPPANCVSLIIHVNPQSFHLIFQPQFHPLTARFSRKKISMPKIFVGRWSRRGRESTQFVGDTSENVVRRFNPKCEHINWKFSTSTGIRTVGRSGSARINFAWSRSAIKIH